jgi:hypothetical protein
MSLGRFGANLERGNQIPAPYSSRDMGLHSRLSHLKIDLLTLVLFAWSRGQYSDDWAARIADAKVSVERIGPHGTFAESRPGHAVGFTNGDHQAWPKAFSNSSAVRMY